MNEHKSYKRVSKRWRLIFESRRGYFALRKEVGVKSPWLFVHAYYTKLEYRALFKVIDLTRHTWHDVRDIPAAIMRLPHPSISASTPQLLQQGIVFFFGCSKEANLKYELSSDSWTKLKETRAFPRFPSDGIFSSASINGMIHVDGARLCCAEVFDPLKETWPRSIITNYIPKLSSWNVATLNGKLLVRCSDKGRVYDPGSDSWENMARGLEEGLVGLEVEMHGRIFHVKRRDHIANLEVYDAGRDLWDIVGALPIQMMHGPFRVACWADDKIYVVSQCLWVAEGHVMINHVSRFYVRWNMIPTPVLSLNIDPINVHVLIA